MASFLIFFRGIGGKLAILGVVALAAFYGGVRLTSDHYKAKLSDMIVAHAEQVQEINADYHVLFLRHRASEERLRATRRTLNQQIADLRARPIYQGQCFDEDGLRIIHEAIDAR